jgi:hypothetical protein
VTPNSQLQTHGEKLPDSRPGFWNANAGGGLGHEFVGDGEVVGGGGAVGDGEVVGDGGAVGGGEVVGDGADKVATESWGHAVGFPDASPSSAKALGRRQLRSQPLERPTCRPGYSS